MFQAPNVHRHANGAINIEHYARIGRRFRALAVRDTARQATSRLSLRQRGLLHLFLLLMLK